MKALLIDGTYIGDAILAMIFFMIVLPATLFLIGLVIMPKKKKMGKVILIIAAIYSIISFGICGSMFV